MMLGDLQGMEENASRAAAFLGGLASVHRLRILCQLSGGEKSVMQLAEETGIAQTSMSQHLARLRAEGIVTYRREHRTLYYAITHPLAHKIIELLYDHYCKGGNAP